MSPNEEYPSLRRALVVSVLAGLVLAGLGYAIGAGNQSNLGGTLNGTVDLSAPQISGFDLNNTGVNNYSQNGMSINVLNDYQLVVTVDSPNGWTNVSKMSFDLWYDNGSAVLGYSGQTAGNNYKLNLTYLNAGQAPAPTMGQWSVGVGNIAFNSGSSWIRRNVAGQNYSFGLVFQLDAQVHHATTPSSPSKLGYVNLKSWNAEFRVMNTSNQFTSVSGNTTGFFLEFGVNQYTSFSSGSPTWTVTGIAPGFTVQTNTVTITFTSNGNFSFNVTLIAQLTSGSNSLTAGDVQVYGGSIAAPGSAFAGIGAGSTIYLLGTSSTEVLQAASASTSSVSVTFRITVPIGTPAGTYTAPIVLSVNQAASP